MKYKKHIFIYFNFFDLRSMLTPFKCNTSAKDNKLIPSLCQRIPETCDTNLD